MVSSTSNHYITVSFSSEQQPLILFRVRGYQTEAVSGGDVLVFPTVEENEGGGYGNTTGVFTAPRKGLYIFTTNICAQSDDLRYAIMKDGAYMGGQRVIDNKRWICTPITVHLYLTEGNKVWVQCTSKGPTKLYDSFTNYWNFFYGSFIHG